MRRSGPLVALVMLAGCQTVPQPSLDPFQARATVPPPALRAPAGTPPVDPYYSGGGRPLPSPAPMNSGAATAIPGTAPPAYVPPGVSTPGLAAPSGAVPFGTQPRTNPPAAFGTPTPTGTPALPAARSINPQPAPYGQPYRAAPYSTPYSAPGVYAPPSGYPAGAPVTIPPDNGSDGASERRPPALPQRGVSIPREAIEGGESGRFGANDEANRGTGRALALRRTKTPLSPEELGALAVETGAEPAKVALAKVAAAPRRTPRPASAPQLRAVDTLPPVATRVARPVVNDEGPRLIAASNALPEISPWTPKEPTVRPAGLGPREETLAARTVSTKTAPAPKVVRPAREEHVDAAKATSGVIQAVHFEPVQEEPAPPRKVVLGQTTRQSTFAADYAWLRGQLEFSAVDRRWKLRYIPIDGDTDRYGGSVVLVDSPKLEGLTAGQWVEIRGRLARAGRGETGYAPPYEVTSIETQ